MKVEVIVPEELAAEFRRKISAGMLKPLGVKAVTEEKQDSAAGQPVERKTTKKKRGAFNDAELGSGDEFTRPDKDSPATQEGWRKLKSQCPVGRILKLKVHGFFGDGWEFKLSSYVAYKGSNVEYPILYTGKALFEDDDESLSIGPGNEVIVRVVGYDENLMQIRFALV